MISIFGSLNLSKRNQSHQTRRSELRIEVTWISQIWLLFQALAAKTRQKGIKLTKPWFEWVLMLWHPQPFNRNPSRRNGSRRTSSQIWLLFQLWQSKPVQKESKSPNQKIRIKELKWFESARFDYFFNLWQPKPVKKESKSPNQKIRIIEIEMNGIRQIWLLFQSLAAKTCPKGISHQTRRSEL